MAVKTLLSLLFFAVSTWAYPAVLDTFATSWVPSPGVDVLADDIDITKCDFGAQLDINDTNIMGRERDIETCGRRVDDTNSAGTAKVVVQNSLAASADSNVYGVWRITWDGPDNDPSVSAMNPPYDLYGATSCDFGGTNERTIFTNLDQQDFCHEHEMRISDADGNVCSLTVLTPRLVVELGCFAVGDSIMRYPLGDFTLFSGAGGSYTPESYPCDFSRVTAVQIIVDAFTQVVDALDFVFDIVSYGCCSNDGECDDGDLCTIDSCVENECVATPVVCDDSNACTSDSCDSSDGQCDFIDIAASCDDTNDCTDDSCDPTSGCVHVPGSSCDDTNECTNDFCAPQGGCQNVAINFDDSNECTADACDPASGISNVPINCDDSDECTLDDCDPLTGCTNVDISANCDDSLLCTTDTCDPVAGCVNTAVDGPNFCDDTDVCTTDDCVGNSCTHDPINCDDTNMCTEDSCDPVNGCQNVDIFLRGDCDDSNDCTADSCDPSLGCQNTAVGCDDSNLCTIDGCDPSGGCTNDPVICDDSDVCTDDFCDGSDGSCATTPSAIALGCDDSDNCSTDTCDPVSGCEYDHSVGICLAQCTPNTASVSPYYVGDPDTTFEASISFSHTNPAVSSATFTIDVVPPGLFDDVFVDPPFPFGDPGQDPSQNFDISHVCVNATVVTIEICVIDQFGYEECCLVVVFCEDSPLCPEVCEEEAKTAICYPDEDDHLNLICAHNDDLDDYYANGGFNPSLTDMYDCNCNPITPTPTSEPTAIPTADPTAIPTSDPTAVPTSIPTAEPTPPPFTIPTADPTAAPTPPPPTPQTPIPSPAPCMYEVPDLPGYIFQCIMDSNYNVDLAVVNATDDYYLDWLYDHWDLGNSIPMLTGPDNLVWYDCWCHAQCPEDHFIIPKLLVDHSWFYGGILRLVVAIPLKFDDTSFYFQDAHSTLPLSQGQCPDGNALDPTSPICPHWTRTDATNSTEEFFRHNCYDAYIVEIPLELLTPEMDVGDNPPHVDGSPMEVDGWEVTYCGVLVSESIQNLGLDIRGIDRNYWFRANYRYCITFPLQVEAHVEDIRVYDEVNKLDELVGAAVYVTGYEWGFSFGGMAQTWGEVRIQTSVQWPFRLEVINQWARTRPDLWVSYAGEGPGTSCDDPLIFEYGDPAWVLDASNNKLVSGNFVPFPCIQEFDFDVIPLTNTSCDLDDYIDVVFAVSCQPSYDSNCPLDERYYDDPLMCTFWLTTENYCDIYERRVMVDADMDSFACSERDCECLEENFIQDFVNQNDEYAAETVYFQVNVDSDEPLAATELHSVETELTCHGGADGMQIVHEMIEIYNIWAMPSYWNQISGTVDNYPVAIGCDGTDMESTVQFQFDLPQDVFDIPFDDSCQLSVWVVIDLFYCGVTRPDRLTPNGPTDCLVGSKLLEKEDSKPELLQTQTGGQSNEDAAFGISRSLRINSFLTVGGRGEVQEIIVDNNDEVDNAEQPRDVTNDKASALRAVPVFALLSLLLALL